MPIPPTRARANSNERFIDRVKPNADEFLKYKIKVGKDSIILAKTKILLIATIISFLISYPDFVSDFMEILLFFSYSANIDEDIVIAISITPPNDPINNPAMKTD